MISGVRQFQPGFAGHARAADPYGGEHLSQDICGTCAAVRWAHRGRKRPVVAALLLAVGNALDLAFPTPVVRVGIVLAVTADSAGNAALAWLAGARKVAWIIGVILLFSAGIGIALIQLT